MTKSKSLRHRIFQLKMFFLFFIFQVIEGYGQTENAAVGTMTLVKDTSTGVLHLLMRSAYCLLKL